MQRTKRTNKKAARNARLATEFLGSKWSANLKITEKTRCAPASFWPNLLLAAMSYVQTNSISFFSHS